MLTNSTVLTFLPATVLARLAWLLLKRMDGNKVTNSLKLLPSKKMVLLRSLKVSLMSLMLRRRRNKPPKTRREDKFFVRLLKREALLLKS